jgi:hypothetical protein
MLASIQIGGFGVFRRPTLISLVLMMATSVGLCTYLLCIYDRETWDTATAEMNRYLERLPQSISHASFGTSISEVQQESNERYCSKEDYANGHWIRRSNPPSSLEDIRDLYSTTVSSYPRSQKVR